jgi:hypothetical protein
MLKLTIAEDEGRTVYIAATAIQSMNRGLGDSGTYVKLHGSDQWVRETPEQILAMPEMVYAMYPAMVVTHGDLTTHRGPPYVTTA